MVSSIYLASRVSLFFVKGFGRFSSNVIDEVFGAGLRGCQRVSGR